MTSKELKSLIKVLRSNGIVSYKANGVELLLDPNFHPKSEKKTKARIKDIQEQINQSIPDLTDEQWLLATSPLDEVTAEEGLN